MCISGSSWGMLEDIISASGFSQPEGTGQVQHAYVIARGELVGVALRLKSGSFCQHGMDRVGFGSGIRWFMAF